MGRRKYPKSWLAIPILLLFGIGVVGVCIVIGLRLRAEETSNLPTREQFELDVMDKTPEEVIRSVGRPDSTQDSGDNHYWYYKNRTIDPVTGRIDWKIQVCFEKGRVSHVNF